MAITTSSNAGPSNTQSPNQTNVAYDTTTGLLIAANKAISIGSSQLPAVLPSLAPGRTGSPTCCIVGESVSSYNMLPQPLAANASFTAKIDNGSGSAGNILTVSATSNSVVAVGANVLTGATGTPQITGFLSGVRGGVGVYTINGPAQLVASTSMTADPGGGDGFNTYVSYAFLPILDTAPLNITAPGYPFDQQVVPATSVNVHGFSFPSNFNGRVQAGAITSLANPWGNSERGWFVWTQMISGWKFRLLFNDAFGGTRAADSLAKLSRDVIPLAPTYCFVMVGINDCVALQAASTTMATIAQIYQTLLAANIIPIALTVLPMANGFPGLANITPIILQLNNLIRNYCAANGIPIIDTFLAMVDTTNTDGRGISTYYNVAGSDFVHPMTQGARALGTMIAQSPIVSSIPAPNILTVNQADNYGTNTSNYNILDTAPWTSSGGTITATGGGTAPTGTVPTGFTLNHVNNTTGTCVASVVARTLNADGDTIGNNVQLVITASSGSADQWTLQTGADVTTRGVAGGVYQFRMTLRLSGTSGSKMYRIGGTTLINDVASNRRGYAAILNTDGSLTTDVQWADNTAAIPWYTLASPPFVMPSWASNGVFNLLTFTFAAAVGTAITINIGRCTLMRLS